MGACGSQTVTMQLVSPSQGNKEVTRNIPATEEWVSIGFDFTDYVGITDFLAMNIQFDKGTPSGTTYYLDNLRQSTSTTDPCEGTTIIPNILDDYECQRNYSVFYGADFLDVVSNPHLNTDNNSLKVGEFTDPANDPWAGLGYQSATPIDLSLYNQLSLQVWSPVAVPVLFKLQGGVGDVTEV